MDAFDICVRGAGVVGHGLALSLARQGLRVALLAEPTTPTGPDVRAYALNTASVASRHAVTAVHQMRIESDQGNTLEFSAWQQRVSALAWIVDAALLEQALGNAVRYAPHITRVSDLPTATLVALCEGKNSSTRQRLGIAFHQHNDGHCAIVARVSASVGHQHTAHQWFRSPDVLALLPFGQEQGVTDEDCVEARVSKVSLPEPSFSLIWSMPGPQAQTLMALDEAQFQAQLQQATQGQCGDLQLSSARVLWPLCHGHAQSWCGPGWVLLGDAAHVVHPLAGQGLNMGLADVAALSQTLAQREPWRSLADARLLRRYERQRQLHTVAMGQLTHGLLQLFSSEQPVLKRLRNQGLGWFNHLTPIKRWAAARAIDF
jgi:2-polyprenyl-6-methoxyphenol hydroxylase-like FAD-dependent oxidoreductase